MGVTGAARPEVPALDLVPLERGLVSVVLPTWNRSYILPRAIDSVLAQGYAAVELIVVDDGSTDDTPAVVARYGSRVRYHQQPNTGVSGARNAGLKMVRGEYVALLDSDDEWFPWKLEAQVAVLDACTDVGMVWSDMSAVGKGGELLEQRYLRTFYSAYQRVDVDGILADRGTLGELAPGLPAPARGARIRTGSLFPHILQGNLVHTSTVLLRRERLAGTGGFDESLKGSGEDYDFHLRTCAVGSVALLDVPTIRYRIGAADQLTAPRMQQALALNDLITVERWLGPRGDEGPLPRKQSRARLSGSHGWVGERLLFAGARHDAWDHLWTSWTLRPSLDRRALLLGAALMPRSAFEGARRLWWWVRHGRNPPL